VTLDVAQVALARGEDFAAICAWMEQRCADCLVYEHLP
jgi:hypothetical protein